jgi:hypothetical protein
VTVTVSAGQSIQVTSSAALGSTAGTGANNLNLYIAYQSSGGGAINLVGAGQLGLSVSKNDRADFTLSAVISGLAAGSYKVGLAGSSSSANWNSNDSSYTSALVFT